MCLTHPMFLHQLWSHQPQFMFPHQSLYQHQLMWLDRILTDTIALTDIITGITKPKEKVAEVTQTYSVTKKNGNLVIVNKDGYVVYHPPHFLKPYIKTREPLQKLADKFTELNTNDVEAIMEFESSLR